MTLKKSEEDIKLDKIGKLLELGGTMLANHCDCGAPLFRYHGNVICPICDSNSKEAKSQGQIEKPNRKPGENLPVNSFQVEQKEESSEKKTPLHEDQHLNEASRSFEEAPQPSTKAQQLITQPSVTSSSMSPETYEFINNTVINKIVQLCLELQRETDQGRIKQQMEAIESGTRVLKNLK